MANKLGGVQRQNQPNAPTGKSRRCGWATGGFLRHGSGVQGGRKRTALGGIGRRGPDDHASHGARLRAPSAQLSLVGLLLSRAQLRFARQHEAYHAKTLAISKPAKRAHRLPTLVNPAKSL